jgi:hypothetical protein
MVVFRWGRAMRIASHELDLENGGVRLILMGGSSMWVPISIVSQVRQPDGKILLNLDLDTLARDPAEPVDTSSWLAARGWSGEERWDEWVNDPQWRYRWTDQDVSWALVPAPPANATELELRLLSISYAIRDLGEVSEPPTQAVEVRLGGVHLGTIELRHDGWQRYRLPLTPRSSAGEEGSRGDGVRAAQSLGGVVTLRLETGYRARPSSFTRDVSADKRTLGVALDHVRYVAGEEQ